VEVVGEASNGEEAVASVAALLPTIVVMDINMPTMNGIEATKSIKGRYPHVAVIGLSVNPDGNNHQLMKQAGAHTTLTKEAAVEHLYSAIQDAVHGPHHGA
jgi:DNA-binding NarL/FixJ family response regulator